MAKVAVPKPKVKMPLPKRPQVGATIPKAPKLPQLQSNLSAYSQASNAAIPKKGMM